MTPTEIQGVIETIEEKLDLQNKLQQSERIIGELILKACGTVILPQVGAPTINKKNLKIVYAAIKMNFKEGYTKKNLYDLGMMALKFPQK